MRLADAVAVFLGTISVANTRRGYAAALDRLMRDFGPDTNVALLDPDRVSGWFTFVWGGRSATTFNVRLAALRTACGYWREQDWLTGDPLVRLRARPMPPDNSKALTQRQIAEVLGLDVPLRERVLWQLLYESAARAEEVLMLDVPDLDTANRCATVTRKGGARDVIVWQTGTARLLPRLLAGRRTGAVFLTDRRAKPSVALADVDPSTGRARLSYRRAAELFEIHTADLAGGPFTLHRLRHSKLTHAAEAGASTPMLMKLSGHTSVRSLAKYAKVSVEGLARWQAENDPAARRRHKPSSP
ncbi:tyrosine-type recombinase/integrase [Rhodococcus sp. NM-2]|uniref:tyrosine-type recombinase/integrase n=1 Tax=unclassified Rhodococcus (in: high G+C Gram-positive bacteria) TaxID=192944 RepID=UPI0022859136|nr:site-specific integrase [Rhodococcus sp. JS3073]WAM14574.1 site-specific integrase [Rhodococcus sp. JS3073]